MTRGERERGGCTGFLRREHMYKSIFFSFFPFFKYVHIDREDGTREIRRR